jgi:hypothetical protein
VGLQRYGILFHLGLGTGEQDMTRTQFSLSNIEIKTRDIYIREGIPSSENEKEPCH